MTSTRLSSAALAAAALLACAPDTTTPADVVVLEFVPKSKKYEPRQVKLSTPTDIVTLEGPVAKLIGSAEFFLDEKDPALASADTIDEIKSAITKDEGNAPKVSWIDNDGVLVPADYHSLNLATSYYNFERTYNFFNKVGGLTAKDFGTPNVYYFPTFTMNGQEQLDNALFMSLIGGFMILPFQDLQMIPLAINRGVVAHEYSHAVFNYRLFDKDPFPLVVMVWSSELVSPGYNLLRSLDEGIADTFSTGVTCSEDLTACDPEYFDKSLPGSEGTKRRVDLPHCLDDGIRQALEGQDAATFHSTGFEYRVGSAFSSALWAAASDEGVIAAAGSEGEARKWMFQALYKALGGTGETFGLREAVQRSAGNQSEFRFKTVGTIKGVADIVIAAAADPTLKRALCSAFLDRLNLSRSEVSECPVEAQSYGECTY